ncbi:SDR family oxidoreductase [Ancylobacter mangrovi]|nr:SDR family oxidoreductase [Ancylobacter mangrovi]MCS0503263.1 SDR family oxidoreductase [Ancylobacter mangrovi]
MSGRRHHAATAELGTFPVDVSDREGLDALVEAVEERFGGGEC